MTPCRSRNVTVKSARPPLDQAAATFAFDVAVRVTTRSPLAEIRFVISDDRATSDRLGQTIVAANATITVKADEETRDAIMMHLTIEREINHRRHTEFLNVSTTSKNRQVVAIGNRS